MDSFEKTDGSSETKPIVSFSGIDKQLILNKTNAGRIIAVLSADDTDQWIGKSITLTTELVDAFGKTQPAIRVKLDSSQKAPGAPASDTTSQFWSKVYSELKLGPEDGNRIIAENGGDIAKALQAVTGMIDSQQAQKDML
ncbi:MAG: hypothetical protein GY752_04620 [bacterium]|nr:hypothetical protein [bacterium]